MGIFGRTRVHLRRPGPQRQLNTVQKLHLPIPQTLPFLPFLPAPFSPFLLQPPGIFFLELLLLKLSFNSKLQQQKQHHRSSSSNSKVHNIHLRQVHNIHLPHENTSQVLLFLFKIRPQELFPCYLRCISVVLVYIPVDFCSLQVVLVGKAHLVLLFPGKITSGPSHDCIISTNACTSTISPLWLHPAVIKKHLNTNIHDVIMHAGCRSCYWCAIFSFKKHIFFFLMFQDGHATWY